MKEIDNKYQQMHKILDFDNAMKEINGVQR